MEHYYLLERDMEDLRDFAAWFKENYPDIMTKDERYGANFKTNKPVYQLGSVIGYKGKTVYSFIKTKSITSRNLNRLTKLVKELKDKKIENPQVKRFIDRLENFRNKIKRQIVDKNAGNHSNGVNSIELNETLESFRNTSFYCYERLIDSIGRKIIKFLDLTKDNKLAVIISPAQKEYSDWSGTAYCDSTQDFLFIESFNSKAGSSNTNYMIRIQKNCKSLSLCIGHMTFQNLTNNNVVTKTVLIEKIANEQEAEPKEFRLSEPDNVNANIKREIIRFLHNRHANRLSSPHRTVITDHQTLIKWHQENDQEKIHNRNNNLLGEYNIYFSPGIIEGSKDIEEPELVKDTLIISENLDMDLRATYFHEVNKGIPHKWEGEVFSSAVTRAVSIFLHGPVIKITLDGRNHILDDKPIFLLLNIPTREKDFDTLTGIVTGIRDNDAGSIGLLVVAIKKDKLLIENEKLVSGLKEFFKAFILRACVRPPVNRTVSTFLDLTRNDGAKEEGLETKRIIKKMLCDFE